MRIVFIILNFFFKFSFFKVFYIKRFCVSDFSFFIYALFFFLFLFFISLLVIYKIIFVLFKEVFILFRILYLNFLNFFFRYAVSFILELILFVYRIRFFFLIGASYYDPLSKIFLDNFSSIKGEFLMDFYNFSSRYLFENDFNVPLSIFNKVPFFDGSKNVFYVKTYSRFFLYFLESQIKVRSFFFFNSSKNRILEFSSKNLKKSFKSGYNYNFLFLDFFSLRFFSFLTIFFSYLDLIQSHLCNPQKLSFFSILFFKYFTLLKNSFIFILINLENDSFIHYLHVTLYKMALQRYYNREDWKNLINTYDFSITNSVVFSGDNKDDFLFFFKITLAYLFVYLNFLFFFLFFLFFFLFWFLYYFVLNFLLFIFRNDFTLFCNLSFFFNFLNLIFLFFYTGLNSLFLFYRYIFNSVKKIKFFLFENFVSSFLFYFILDFLSIFYLCCVYLLYVLRIIWLLFFNFFAVKFTYFFDLNKNRNYFNINISRKLFDFIFSEFLNNSKNLDKKRNSLFMQNFFSHESFVKNGQTEKNDFFNLLLLKEFIYLKLFTFYFSDLIIFKYSDIFFYFRILLFRISCWFFFWSSLLNVKYDTLFASFDSSCLILIKRINLFIFINLWLDRFIIWFSYYLNIFFKLVNILNLKEFYKILFFCFFGLLKVSWFLFLNFLFFCFYSLFLLFFYFNFCLFGIFLFFSAIILFFLFYNYFLFKVFSFFVYFFFIPLFFFIFRLSFRLYYGFKETFLIVYLSLYIKVIFRIFAFYFKTLLFLKRRNFGFLKILSIFFLIRNDLKKYELIHFLNPSNMFRAVSIDLFLDSFFNKYQTSLFSLFRSNFKKKNVKESMDLLDFSRFKLKMNLPYNNLKEYALGKKLEKNIELKNDLFAEFEYHKYLRSRQMRNLKIFRFRKMIEPFDFYMDPNLDGLTEFNSKDSKVFNFDFLKFFYNDDYIFLKDLKYFRDTFSRRNLSFFYDNLDRLSNFRLRYLKLPPLFRYFYLKRERFKYLLTLYTYGNLNTFSFSIVLNWILNYRVLRSILVAASKLDYTLFFSGLGSSRFFFFSFLMSFDKFFLFLTYFMVFFFCIIFLIFVFFLDYTTFLIVLFICFFICFRNFLILKKINTYIFLFYNKPFLFNIKTLFFSLFTLKTYSIVSFSFQKLYIVNFGIFFRLFIYVIYLFIFFFLNLILNLYFHYIDMPLFFDLFSGFHFLRFIDGNIVIIHIFFEQRLFASFFFISSFFSFFLSFFFFSLFYLLFKFFVYRVFNCLFFSFEYAFYKFFLTNPLFLRFLSFDVIYPSKLLREVDLLIDTISKENLYIKKNFIKK